MLPRPTAAPSISMRLCRCCLSEAAAGAFEEEVGDTALEPQADPLDVRIIASTNRPISEVVASVDAGGYSVPAQYHQHPDPALRRKLDSIPFWQRHL